ncbi:RTC4-like domain-containing protein [Russula earlei]|uniref:RTC4-like domain-containing protein n=1 Tax=Russula earlei TaxID=71964 RepID=A0ACC0U9P8_9AGAM|nr:RTC4-like domain-containing protein [Russula earlei]
MFQAESLVSPPTKKESGKLWDDLGCTAFVTTGNNLEKTRSFTRDMKRDELRKRIDDSSDDELDFLSSSSRSDDVERPIPTRNKPRAKKKRPGRVTIQGQEVDHHTDPLPRKKLPDFKKIKHAVPEGSSSSSRSETPNATQNISKQTKSYGILATLHNNENKRFSVPSDDLSSDKDSLGGYTHPSIHVSPQLEVQKFPGLTLSPLRSCDWDSLRPDVSCGRMKAAISYKQSKRLLKRTSYNSDTNSRSAPASRHSFKNQSSDSSDSSEATPRVKDLKHALRKFPSLGPLSISDHLAPEPDGGTGKSPYKGTTISQAHSKSLSDMATPRPNRKSRDPFLSHLSSPAHPQSQDTATTLQATITLRTLDSAVDEDADDESPKRRPQLRPFPMAASRFKETCTPRRKVTYVQQACPDNGKNDPFVSDLEVGDDSLFVGESTDPWNLCPFCDEKLPPNPSPFYRSLFEGARRKAHPDPRPSNPLGLKALMGVYIASCKRHRFEAHQIPEAMAKGWPTDIDFGRVRRRVERLSGRLAKLVRDEGNAREESIYWTTVTKEVRKLGSRAASGVKGQFESFEKTQPGYYGELGSMILHQTLYNMFPPSSFEPQSITPLTPQEFIQRILVPEAAVTLIMEDTGQDRARAVQTMRESAGYGVAMFPDISDGLEVGAGEDIVIERARARRRELEDEERVEALLHPGDSDDGHHAQTKGTKRPKTLSSATTTDIEESNNAQSRTKRMKPGSRIDAESGSDGHVFQGSRDTNAYKSKTAASSNPAAEPFLSQSYPSSPPNRQSPRVHSPDQTQASAPRPESRAPRLQPTPTLHVNVKPCGPPTTSDPQKGSDWHSMSSPIDRDDIVEVPSPFEQRPPSPVDGMARNVQRSSDANEPGGYNKCAKSMPKARRRIAEPKVQHLGPNDPIPPSPNQNIRRDSSVE